MDGSLVAPDAQLSLVGSKRDAVDFRFIASSAELADKLACDGIPDSYECASGGSCS